MGNRRGRPRIERPEQDRGTVELQARRSADQRSSYPLGVLFMAGDITDEQHQAACWYAWLYGFVCGRTSAAAVDWERQSSAGRDHWPGDLSERLKGHFRMIADRLAMDRSTKDALENLVVYDRAPRWMQPRRPTPADIHDANAFHRGLALVTDLFGKMGGTLRRAA